MLLLVVLSRRLNSHHSGALSIDTITNSPQFEEVWCSLVLRFKVYSINVDLRCSVCQENGMVSRHGKRTGSGKLLAPVQKRRSGRPTNFVPSRGVSAQGMWAAVVCCLSVCLSAVRRSFSSRQMKSSVVSVDQERESPCLRMHLRQGLLKLSSIYLVGD